jgi:hypothetical protein
LFCDFYSILYLLAKLAGRIDIIYNPFCHRQAFGNARALLLVSYSSVSAPYALEKYLKAVLLYNCMMLLKMLLASFCQKIFRFPSGAQCRHTVYQRKDLYNTYNSSPGARTAEGRSRAKAQGKHMGRPPSLTPAQQEEATRRRAQGATLQELADSYDRSISTMRRATRAA